MSLVFEFFSVLAGWVMVIFSNEKQVLYQGGEK